jgi:hypothetical protein
MGFGETAFTCHRPNEDAAAVVVVVVELNVGFEHNIATRMVPLMLSCAGFNQ